ncbi:MAG: quinate 5-dehydrogenase [Coriobacteriia bacterium]|nr:quinate 5-dehydrogenase [Coriobacteriia bacterium]
MSISLGSSARNHQSEVQLGDQHFIIRREGTDGDFALLKQRLIELDANPQVCAIGLGGTDLFLNAAGRTYHIREMKPLVRLVENKALVDGSGLKGIVEADTIRYLCDAGLRFAGKRALVTSAVDRWGLAMALNEAGADTDYGDLYYILGIRAILSNERMLTRAVRLLGPIAVRLPFSWLYPSAADHKSQTVRHQWTDKLYHNYDIVAGDYKYVAKYMPPDLDDVWVITNTTTPKDVDFLRSRGVSKLVTTTPRLDGRSLGTNAMEALLVAAAGKKAALAPEHYLQLLAEYNLHPSIQDL